MSWAGEFGEKYEVPSFLHFLADEEQIIEDMSWHNDASPSYGVFDEKTQKEVRIWVEHPIRDFREFGGKRFLVTYGDIGGEVDIEYEEDELEMALRRLFELLAKYYTEGGTHPELRKRWRPTPTGGEWDDPDAYLEELIEKFYRGA